MQKSKCLEVEKLRRTNESPSHNLLPRLGIQILPDHRVCLDGKVLTGVVFPKRGTIQAVVMKQLLVWYFPCLKLQDSLIGNSPYKWKSTCLMYRESQLLGIFKHMSRKLERQLGIGPKYFYMPLKNTLNPIKAT